MIFNKKNGDKISLKTAPQVNKETDAEIKILNLLSRHIQSHPLFKNHVYLVGGLVRDFLLNLPVKDIDLVVDFPRGAQNFCEDLHQSFPDITSKPHELGRGYPIWHILIQDIGVDVAETQKECFPDPESRQRITTFGTFTEDIFRRDFTINMLAYDFTKDQILDPSGCGLEDLQKGIIQTHPQLDPDKVFSDDPLRMLRAVRFAVKFVFKISESTKAAIIKNAQRLKIVSSERILNELEKIASYGKLPQALMTLNELQLFSFIFKNLQYEKINISQNLELMQKAPATLKSQLAFLGLNQDPKTFEELLYFLKLDNKTRQSLLKTIAGVKEAQALHPSLHPTLPDIKATAMQGHQEINLKLVQRSWARKYYDVLEDIFNLDPDLKTQFSPVLDVPLRTKPLVKAEQLQSEYGLKGEQIKQALGQALELEDRWILENQKEISVDKSWSLLTDFLKNKSSAFGADKQ